MKKLLIFLAMVLVLAGIMWSGRPLYRHWQGRRLIAQSQQFLATNDFRDAALTARLAIDLNPSDIEACRILGRICDSFRSPLALQWWRRVVDLEPHTLTNRLELAKSAMLNGNYLLAAQTLHDADKTNQNTVAYHEMAAMASVGLNDIAAADWHFKEAAKLDPENKLVQLDEAVIHLQARDQQVVAGALKTLERLYSDPTYHMDALRHLAMTAERNKDFARAEAFTDELQADPKATAGDRLMHLTVLKESGSTNFTSYLSELESRMASDPEQINALVSWLLTHDMVGEAARWANGLPDALRAKQPVKLTLTDIYSAQKDWPRLQAILQDDNWGDVDYMRLALLSRACREQRQDMAGQANWHAALNAAMDRAKPLSILVRMVGPWGWEREKEELLWILVQRFPGERWAMQSLNQLYLSTGNTRGLQKLYSTLVDYDAGDVIAKNNLASLLMLLNVQTGKAHEMAREAYKAAPPTPRLSPLTPTRCISRAGPGKA